MTPSNRLRLTSRLVVMDPTGSILMFKTAAPDSSGYSRWITPGGGVDGGETHAEAAVRELWEETGQHLTPHPIPVWTYDFEVNFDQADHNRGHAEYFFVATERFEPVSTYWTTEEHIDVTAWRWWGALELEASQEPFEPAHLPTLIRECLPLL